MQSSMKTCTVKKHKSIIKKFARCVKLEDRKLLYNLFMLFIRVLIKKMKQMEVKEHFHLLW